MTTVPNSIDADVNYLVSEYRRMIRGIDRSPKMGNLFAKVQMVSDRAQRSRSAGTHDLCGELLGLSGYLSFFADDACEPTKVQLEQLTVLIDSVEETLQGCWLRSQSANDHLSYSPVAARTKRTIHFLSNNKSHLLWLRRLFGKRGLDVVYCDSVPRLISRVADHAVLAIVIGADHLDQWTTAFRDHRLDGCARVPRVVLSEENNLRTHKSAAQCEADAVFACPDDAATFATRLLRMIAARREFYKALIVEEDVPLRLYCGCVLRHNNVHVHAASNPEEANLALQHFNPDIILAGQTKAHVPAVELAPILRAHARAAVIPLIAMNCDATPESSLPWLRLGCDGYVMRPLVPSNLVSVVIGRARRMRCMGENLDRRGAVTR